MRLGKKTNHCNIFSQMATVLSVANLPARAVTCAGRQIAQARLIVNGEKPWQVGISSMLLTFTCGGSVAIQ